MMTPEERTIQNQAVEIRTLRAQRAKALQQITDQTAHIADLNELIDKLDKGLAAQKQLFDDLISQFESATGMKLDLRGRPMPPPEKSDDLPTNVRPIR